MQVPQVNSKDKAKLGWRSILSVVLPINLLILLPELLAPFNDDDELFHSMGWLQHAFDRIPYLSFWDQNFPGITKLHSLIISLFGVSPIAYRSVDIAAHLLLTLLIAILISRLYDKRTAIIASILYSLSYMQGGFWAAGQRDGFGSLLMIIATMLYLVVHRKAIQSKILNYGALGIAGILMGVAVTFRPTQGLIGVALGIIILIYERNNRWSYFTAYLIGAIGVWCIILLSYGSHAGTIREFYLDAIYFNSTTFTSPEYDRPGPFLLFRPRELFYSLLIFIWLGWYVRRMGWPKLSAFGNRLRQAPMEIMLFAAYYITAKVGMIVMGKYFIAHYHPQIVLMAILAAILLNALLNRFEAFSVVKYLFISLFVLSVAAVYASSRVPAFVGNIITGKGASLHSVYEKVNGWELEYEKATEYLVRHGAQGNRLEVWGWCPGLYWRTGCNASSRFPFMLPLIMTGSNGTPADFQRTWQKEFIDSLTLAPPKFLVVARDSFGLGIFYYHAPVLLVDSVPGFRALIDTKYQVDTLMPYWDIYRRREAF